MTLRQSCESKALRRREFPRLADGLSGIARHPTGLFGSSFEFFVLPVRRFGRACRCGNPHFTREGEEPARFRLLPLRIVALAFKSFFSVREKWWRGLNSLAKTPFVRLASTYWGGSGFVHFVHILGWIMGKDQRLSQGQSGHPWHSF